MSDTTTPPSPEGVPVLGHGYAFSRDPFGSLERWADHGDVVRLEFPGQTIYMLSEPSLIEAVFLDSDGRFTISDQQRETFEGIEDHALSAATGERWRRLRTALHPAFTRERIERYGEEIVATTRERLEEFEEGERIDLHRQMRLLTIHVVTNTLLDLEVRGNEKVVMDATDALVARTDPRRFGQLLPDWVPTPTDRRFERAVSDLEGFLEGALEDRLERKRASGSDALSIMLDASERGEITTEEILDNAVALLLAGSDTTALALTYCWYALEDHPELEDSLVAEYDEHVGEGPPDVDALEDLEGLSNVVDETLRLYPPTWNSMRKAKTPVVVGDYRLPEGATIMLPQWVVHRDDRYWDDPDTFDPSRWKNEEGRPEYAYFPFGGGPRHCIGMSFARLEIRLALATMLSYVDLEVTADDPLTFVPSLSLRPESTVTATVRRR